MKEFQYLQEAKKQFIRMRKSKENRLKEAEKAYKQARANEKEALNKYKDKLLEQAHTDKDLTKEINASFDEMEQATKEADKAFNLLETIEKFVNDKPKEHLSFTGKGMTEEFNKYMNEFIENEVKQLAITYAEAQKELKEKLEFLRKQAKDTNYFLTSIRGGSNSNGYDIDSYAISYPLEYELYEIAFGKRFTGWAEENPFYGLYK